MASLLIETEDIPCGIAKPRSNLGSIRADRLHDLASVSDDGVDGRGNVVNHDVDLQPGLARWRPTGYLGATDLTDAIIERSAAVTAPPSPCRRMCSTRGNQLVR